MDWPPFEKWLHGIGSKMQGGSGKEKKWIIMTQDFAWATRLWWNLQKWGRLKKNQRLWVMKSFLFNVWDFFSYPNGHAKLGLMSESRGLSSRFGVIGA
jgi:hypothetical protein